MINTLKNMLVALLMATAASAALAHDDKVIVGWTQEKQPIPTNSSIYSLCGKGATEEFVTVNPGANLYVGNYELRADTQYYMCIMGSLTNQRPTQRPAQQIVATAAAAERVDQETLSLMQQENTKLRIANGTLRAVNEFVQTQLAGLEGKWHQLLASHADQGAEIVALKTRLANQQLIIAGYGDDTLSAPADRLAATFTAQSANWSVADADVEEVILPAVTSITLALPGGGQPLFSPSFVAEEVVANKATAVAVSTITNQSLVAVDPTEETQPELPPLAATNQPVQPTSSPTDLLKGTDGENIIETARNSATTEAQTSTAGTEEKGEVSGGTFWESLTAGDIVVGIVALLCFAACLFWAFKIISRQVYVEKKDRRSLKEQMQELKEGPFARQTKTEEVARAVPKDSPLILSNPVEKQPTGEKPTVENLLKSASWEARVADAGRRRRSAKLRKSSHVKTNAAESIRRWFEMPAVKGGAIRVVDVTACEDGGSNPTILPIKFRKPGQQVKTTDGETVATSKKQWVQIIDGLPNMRSSVLIDIDSLDRLIGKSLAKDSEPSSSVAAE